MASSWLWINGPVVRVLDFPSAVSELKTTRCLQSRITFSSFQGQLNEYSRSIKLPWRDKHNIDFYCPRGVFLEKSEGQSESVVFVQNCKYLAYQNQLQRRLHENKLWLFANKKTISHADKALKTYKKQGFICLVSMIPS